jgi:hypothetical protein
MENPTQLIVLYLVALTIITVLLYFALNKKQKKVVAPKIAAAKHASFVTHHWGYGWRPWWKRYNGVPGVM